MAESTPKILLLGDYSNCHRTLSRALTRLGCDVTLASDGCGWMRCGTDIDISRPSAGRIGGLLHYINMQKLLKKELKGYDIVAVHDPNFTHLRPWRLRALFDLLRKGNGRVFLTAMSTDIPYLDMLEAPDSPLRYSEWFVDGKPSRHHIAEKQQWDAWHVAPLRDYHNHFYDNIDGAVSVLYEYHLAIKRRLGDVKVAYGGIPVETSLYTPVEIPDKPEKIKLFLGRDRTRMLMKGSDMLETAARDAIKRNNGKASLEIVENVPFAEFVNRLKDSHVVLDQTYSYTPATTALMAMAYGLNIVTGGEPEYYDFIGEKENRPIINAPISVDGLTDCLDSIIRHPGLIAERGRRSREFVMKHNDSAVVARRFLDFWLSKC